MNHFKWKHFQPEIILLTVRLEIQKNQAETAWFLPFPITLHVEAKRVLVQEVNKLPTESLILLNVSYEIKPDKRRVDRIRENEVFCFPYY